MYADDTVIFYAHEDPNQIEKSLNEDMDAISKYCVENELVINFKKGKKKSCGSVPRND